MECGNMSLKSIVRDLKGMKNGIGSISKQGVESKHWLYRSNSHLALDVTPIEPIQRGQWESLPPELLLDIIRRVEESETSWPARAVVVFCASVCKSWRSVTLEIVKTLQQCGRLTFPISLKQPGPRDYPIQCFIRRNKRTSTFQLYLGLVPSENESNKLLLASKRTRRSDFVISLAADDFSQASNKYVGKVRSNFWGTDFTIYDSQPPHDAAVRSNCSHLVSTICYEIFTRKPTRMHCIMNSNIVTTIQEGRNAPSRILLPQIFDEPFSPSPTPKGKSSTTISYSASPSKLPGLNQGLVKPLLLKSKDCIWNEYGEYWYLDLEFTNRTTKRSVKNFQLIEYVDPSHNVSPVEPEKVILQFGKIGKDIFTMDYSYPLSAFQAFAICLTSMRALKLHL